MKTLEIKHLTAGNYLQVLQQAFPIISKNLVGFRDALRLSSGQFLTFLTSLGRGEADISQLNASLNTLKGGFKGLTSVMTAHPFITAAVAIGVLIAAIYKVKQYYDDLDKKSKELLSNYQSEQKTIEQHKSTIEDVGDRYSELSKGVNSLGQNVSLTTAEFDEYNDICSQIAEMYPSLIQGWTAEGNAILTLKGNVEGLTQALKDEQIASNNAFITENKDVTKNTNQQQILFGTGRNNKNGLTTAAYNTLKELYSAENLEDYIKTNFDKVDVSITQEFLKKVGINDDWYDLTLSGAKVNEKKLAQYLKENKSTIMSYLDSFGSDLEASISKDKGLAEAYLSNQILNAENAKNGTTASNLSEEMQSLVTSIIHNVDYDTAAAWKDYDDIKNYVNGIINDIDSLGENGQKTITTFLEVQTKYNNSECTAKEYDTALKNFNNSISQLDEETQKEIKVALGLDTDDFFTTYNKAVDIYNKSKATGGQKWFESLTKQELEIIATVDVDTDTADWDLKRWKRYVETQTVVKASLDFDIKGQTEKFSSINDIIKSSTAGAGLTIVQDGEDVVNQMEVIKNAFADLDSFDQSKIFERTSNGIKLNSDELHRLQDEQVKIQKNKFNKSLKYLDTEYDDLTEQIAKCGEKLEDYSNLSEKDRQALIDQSEALIEQRNEVVDNIGAISDLASQYEGLTSAYNEWINAKDGAEDGDTYDNIRSGLEDITKLYEKGLVGTNEFESYMKLITGTDFSNKSVDEITQAYKNLGKEIGNTGYTIKDFLKEDEKGVENFLKAASKIKGSGISEENGEWQISIKNTKDLADDLGVSVEFVESILMKLRDYKFDIDFDDEVNEKYKKLSEYAEKANEELIKSGQLKTAFNFNTKDLDEAQGQIETFFNELEDENGKIHLDSSEAQNAVTVLDTLQKRRDELNKPAIMSVNTDAIRETDAELANAIDLVNQFSAASAELNNLNEKKKINATVDTTEAQKKVQDLAGKLQDLGKTDAGARLKLDDTEVQTTLNNIKNTKVSPKVDINPEDLTSINNRISNLNPSDIKIKGDSSDAESKAKKAKNLIESIPDKDIKMTVSGNALGTLGNIISQQNKIKDKTVTYTTNYKTTGTPPSGNSPAQGTAHASGSAFADGSTSGSWRIGFDGTSLMGEVGYEILVRDGKFYIVGEDSAEFVKHKKNDIVFNNAQAQSILKYGKIPNGKKRGTTFADGSAFAGSSVNGGGSFVTYKSSNNNNKKSTKSSKSTKKRQTVKDRTSKKNKDNLETFDWIEVKISRIERQIKNLQRTAESVYKTFGTRNKALTKEISKTSEEIKVQEKAAKRYYAQADSVKLSKKLKKKVRNGTININDYGEKTAEKIKAYQQWYEKALACKDAIAELKESVAELYETAFNNKVDEYEGKIAHIESHANLINSYIKQGELMGYRASANYYTKLQSIEKQNIAQLEAERKALIKARDNAVNSGAIKKGSKAYQDMVAEIDKVSEALVDANNNLLEYANNIRQIKWDNFDYLHETISGITKESDFLIKLMSNSDLFKDGQITEQGQATMGLHVLNYNTYMEQALDYGRQIEEINKDIAKNPYDTELIKRRQELIETKREFILNAEEENKAIQDLAKDGIEAELKALKELIDKYEDAMDSQKDMYDYQKNIKDQTKEIASLQKQLIAYSNNDTDEGKLKRQQLGNSLQEAQEKLQETQYDRYITDQKKLLDTFYNDYEDVLNQRFDDTDELIRQVVEGINQNADTVKKTLEKETKKVGIILGDTINGVFATGKPLTNYFGDMSSFTSAFTNYESGAYWTNLQKALGGINTYVNRLNQAADTKANANVNSAGGTNSTNDNSSGGGSGGSGGGSSKQGNGKAEKGDKVTVPKGTAVYSDKKHKKKLFSTTKTKNKRTAEILAVDGNNIQIKFLDGSAAKGKKGWVSKSSLKGYQIGSKSIQAAQMAWTQEGNKSEFIVRKSDGAVLTPLGKGDTVLSNQMTNRIWDMANNPTKFILDNLGTVETGTTPNITSNVQTVNNQIDLDISLPNVTNYDDFVRQAQKDPKFEKLIQAMTIDRINGKTALSKFKINVK